MEEKVSILCSSRSSSKYRILAGVDVIAQCEIDLLIFKQCLALIMAVIKFTKFHFSRDWIQISVVMRQHCACMNVRWSPDQKR